MHLKSILNPHIRQSGTPLGSCTHMLSNCIDMHLRPRDDLEMTRWILFNTLECYSK